MKISIVIPTMNRLSSLQRVITGLLEQTYPSSHFEVIVVSDGSTDGTEQYLAELSTPFRLSTIIQANQGVARARNAGISQAQGEILIFLDDDTVPAPDFIEQHARFHELHGSEAVVIGPMLAPENHRPAPWVSWEQSRLDEQYQEMQAGLWDPSPRQFYTANASLARRHLLESGGFDPAFRRAEDVELAYRLEKQGLRFYFHPAAVVYHYAERSFEAWVSIPYAYGVNDVIFTYQKKQSWLLPTIYKEFHTRHPFIRFATQLCLNRKNATRLLMVFLKQMALLSMWLKLVNLSHLACSGIFNLRYYQGVSDGLGSHRVFLSGIRDAVTAS
jgi:GT2 family glycosyltransferase